MRVGEEATATLHVFDVRGQEYEKPVDNISCELVSCHDASTVTCTVTSLIWNKYKITYKPLMKGEHKLHVEVEGTHVKGSPFTILVNVPISKLGSPTKIIDGLSEPMGVAVSGRGEIVVTEYTCMSIFSPQGDRIRTIEYDSDLSAAVGVAVDKDGSILVIDRVRHTVRRYSSDGDLIKSKSLHAHPSGVSICQDGTVCVSENCGRDVGS